MNEAVRNALRAYDPDLPLDRASTIPSAFYTDPAFLDLELKSVFSRSWQFIARVDQLIEPGSCVAGEIAGEPVVVVRGRDGVLRGFFNVCRHHAAEIVARPACKVSVLRCPYHGWTYDLDGRLKGAPELDGVRHFDKEQHGLAPVRVESWEQFVFARLADDGPDLWTWLGEMVERVARLGLSRLEFLQRRSYDLNCNWKVYVDNYLDGGYHVPHIHKGLGSVLDYSRYAIENRGRFCLQSSPIDASGADAQVAGVRRGDMAYYYWLYPNFMLNWYEGVMDVNIVLPTAPDRTQVVFDYYFAPSSAEDVNRTSIEVAERIQQEDIDICESVQRGLRSRAYDTGRLSPRREAGEHLFHRLLHADLSQGAH